MKLWWAAPYWGRLGLPRCSCIAGLVKFHLVKQNLMKKSESERPKSDTVQSRLTESRLSEIRFIRNKLQFQKIQINRKNSHYTKRVWDSPILLGGSPRGFTAIRRSNMRIKKIRINQNFDYPKSLWSTLFRIIGIVLYYILCLGVRA